MTQRRLESCLLLLEAGIGEGGSISSSLFGTDNEVRLNRSFADSLYSFAMKYLPVRPVKIGDNAVPVEFFIADAAEDAGAFIADCARLLVESLADLSSDVSKHGALDPEADRAFACIAEAVEVRRALRNFMQLPREKNGPTPVLLLHHSILNADNEQFSR